MTSILDRGGEIWRRAALVLATLALVIKVLVPPGFMVAEPQRNELPFALVLCTGEGPIALAPGESLSETHGDEREPAGSGGHDAPCLFAGQGVGAPAPDLLSVAPVEFLAYAAAQPSRPRFDMAPGRGLAAPPLPARGPPARMI